VSEIDRHFVSARGSRSDFASFTPSRFATVKNANVIDRLTPQVTTQDHHCSSGMVEVKGDYCEGVAQYCTEYISEKRDRCAAYRSDAKCFGKTKRLHFCIDRYEYPNRRGEKPTVAVTYNEATELCAAQGKRLCTAAEWTQACEGPKHLPYPYGFVRDSKRCNHDKPYIIPNNNAYATPTTRKAELARVDQSEPSGSRTACVSSYGVFDMTGNVDEWVYNESGSINGPTYDSGLKGGYWGPVRNRCRPTTTDHNRWHSGYQIGLRCCRAITSPNETQQSPTLQEYKPAANAALDTTATSIERSRS
jgi:hypothetical protein